MGRNILITEGNEKRTNKDFSILSLALLSLPFIIPVTFSFFGLNSRTSADFFLLLFILLLQLSILLALKIIMQKNKNMILRIL